MILSRSKPASDCPVSDGTDVAHCVTELAGQSYLDLCAQAHRGEIIIHSISTVTGRNGSWRVHFTTVGDPPSEPS